MHRLCVHRSGKKGHIVTVKEQREILNRLYACVNTMAGIGCSNPCDIGLLARSFQRLEKATRLQFWVLMQIQAKDYEAAKDNLTDLEQFLKE